MIGATLLLYASLPALGFRASFGMSAGSHVSRKIELGYST